MYTPHVYVPPFRGNLALGQWWAPVVMSWRDACGKLLSCCGKALCMASSAIAFSFVTDKKMRCSLGWNDVPHQNAYWSVMTRHTMSYQKRNLSPLVFYKTKIPEHNSMSPHFTMFATVIDQVHSYSVTTCCIQNTS